MHGANGETNLVAGGAGDDFIVFRVILVVALIIESLKQRIDDARYWKIDSKGNDTIELEALGSNCVYVNLQGDVAEDLEDCDGDDISITAGL